MELKNRFSELEGLIEEIDISEGKENIVKTIVEIAGEIGGVTCKKHNNKLSERTKQLIRRLRDMMLDNQNTSCRMDYLEL